MFHLMPSHSRVEARQNGEFSGYKILAIVLASIMYQWNITISLSKAKYKSS